MTELLSAHPLFRSTDIDEIRDTVATAVSPYHIDPYPHRTSGVSVFNGLSLGDVAIYYTILGAPVRLRRAPLDSFLLVRFSLAGALTVHAGRSDMQFDRNAAAVADPDIAYDASIDSGARALLLRVERRAVQAELHRMLGRPPARRLRFDPSLAMSTPQARSWFTILRALCTDLDGPQGLSHPALHRPVERLITAQLLTTVPHSATDELTGRDFAMSLDAGPKAIQRADQLIEDHCHELLSVSDIAEAVGVSVRSLQHGFRRYLNTTPVERLRHARLTRARAELTASDPTRTTVARVALNWGFRHLGRFAASYQTAFGEPPSQTLRR